MKKKRLTALLMTALLLLFAFTSTSTTAFAGLNLGNDDGTDFQGGTSNNYWGVYTDSGVALNDTEGLRVTVYNAETNSKVFNTIDITGNPNISAVSSMRYFADGSELISKTTWLNYVSSTYNSVDTSGVSKFNNAVTTRLTSGDGYRAEYIAELATIDIVSSNNTANLEAIKALLGKKEFLVHLCSLLSGLEYKDFEDGKYKIAFEPVAYFRYNGQNWAMSATECGLLNKYMKNYFSAAWNTSNNLRALLGPLTHSNLPRSAFLEYKDLGVSVYSPSESDYYNGNANYNSDTCIIRCMGIGIIGREPVDEDDDEDLPDGESTAKYHTDTEVYTSFEFSNESEDDIISGSTVFAVPNADGEYPKYGVGPTGKLVHVRAGSAEDHDGRTAYTTDEVGMIYQKDNVPVYREYTEEEMEESRYYDRSEGLYYGPLYKNIGSFSNGEFITTDTDTSTGQYITYSVKTAAGTVIAHGTVQNSCPAGETGMGWFKWKTPKTPQKVTITITPSSHDIKIIDDEGNRRNSLRITAKVDEVKEITPPDPKVTDTRPDWHKLFRADSVGAKISQYAPSDGCSELTWYTWTCASSWRQDDLQEDNTHGRTTAKFDYIIDPDYYEEHGNYIGADVEEAEYDLHYFGVNNGYQTKSGIYKRVTERGAVILTMGDWEKVEFTVSLDADMEITPSEHCYTATYSNSSGMYTMKSGYGFEISIDCHIDGDTSLCTGSQQANVLFPEFNYNRQSTAKYNRLLEKDGTEFVFKVNPYSTYGDRVHFTPIWYPDNKNYTVYAEVFDVWCPAGQLSMRLTDSIKINGNVYDDWHIAPVKP